MILGRKSPDMASIHSGVCSAINGSDVLESHSLSENFRL